MRPGAATRVVGERRVQGERFIMCISVRPDRDIDVIPFAELAGPGLYDVVLVDEAQDMMSAEAMDRLDAVLVGGRAAEGAGRDDHDHERGESRGQELHHGIREPTHGCPSDEVSS